MDAREPDRPSTDKNHDQAHQDGIIAKRLPAWLRLAPADQLEVLKDAMTLNLYHQERAQARLGQLQHIDAFAVSKLETALKVKFNADYPARQWQFRLGYWEPVIGSQPVGSHLSEARYERVSLVEAALRNFTEAEAKPVEAPTQGGVLARLQQALANLFSSDGKTDLQAPGNGLVDPAGKAQATPTPQAFAALCRDLDLGGQYQRHLDEVLQPSKEEPVAAATLLARAQRYAMLVDACVAHMQGVLSDTEYQFLVALCLLRRPRQLDGKPFKARRLHLLGIDLEQIVVIEVFDRGAVYNTVNRVLVYIPADPQGAWGSYKDLRHFANALGKRLRKPAYQRVFARFVRRRDSHDFFHAVITGYRGVSDLANIDLGERLRDYPAELFASLGQGRVEQLKDDASLIAVPTAQLDREIQRKHELRLKAEGWALLTLAGLFVPGIGIGLLAASTWALLGEAYHGIEAWRQGESSDALDHLLNVATDLAVLGASAAGVGLAQRAWSRSTLVDSMLPALLEDGSVKLWKEDVSSFRSASPPPTALGDAAGIQRLEGQSWVQMQGQYFPVVQRVDDGQWQLLPQEGHGPLLRDNGAGAWRLWTEQPVQWAGSHYLFRRLGGRFAELDDEQIDQVLSFHGLGEDELRAWHVYGQVPEAEVVDSVERIQLDQRIRTLIGQLRAGQPVTDMPLLQQARRLPGAGDIDDLALAQRVADQRRALLQQFQDTLHAPDSVQVAALRRMFPRLHPRSAQALLDTASAADRQRLEDSSRVPLHLAEAARRRVLRIRVARACEALYLDVPQDSDLARVVLGMLKHLPGGTEGIRWRLFEQRVNGPLLAQMEEGATALDLVHVDGRFCRFDADGMAEGEPGELFDVLAAAYTPAQRAAMTINEPMAHNLRVMIGRLAVSRREELAQLLGDNGPRGWFQPPQRLADGRIGYPLSGRGPRAQSLRARLRNLYPSYNDAQLTLWLNQQAEQPGGIDTVLTRLEAEYRVLIRDLNTWISSARDDTEAEQRHFFGKGLLDCWQRRLPDQPDEPELIEHYWWSQSGAEPRILPALPEQVRLSHVTALSLRGMSLEAVPDEFLQAFPNVRLLELSSNNLTRLPLHLTQLPNLKFLDLYGNQIALDPGQSTILANCESLVYLNLSHNPLGRTFSVHAMPDLVELHLRNTSLRELPYGVLECQQLRTLDLSNNQITTLPTTFFDARVWREGEVRFNGNPFTEAQTQRFRAALPAPRAPQVAPNDPVPARTRWLDVVDSQDRDELASLWALLEAEPRAEPFFQVLQAMLGTAEFRSPVGASSLARRLLDMLAGMYEHPALRDLLFSAASDFTCVDSVALCFSDLEVRRLVWQAERSATGPQRGIALLRLGRQLSRLDALDSFARQDLTERLAAGQEPDEIEVVLAYRLALRIDLDLPIQTHSMQFGELAQVGQTQIARARAWVLDGEREQDRLRDSLVARDFWRTYLRSAHAEAFAELDATYSQRIEHLMADHQVPEAERLARIADLGEAQRLAENDKIKALTRQALETVFDEASVPVR